MNAFTPYASGPIPGTPLYQAVHGNAASSCNCGAVLAESRSLLSSLATSSTAIAQDAAQALRMAAALSWDGTAGELFRQEARQTLTLAEQAQRNAHDLSVFVNGSGAVA